MNLDIDATREEKRITEFINNVLKKTGASGIVVALSGGVDSATALALVVKAVGREKVHVLLLPYGDRSDSATKRAANFVQELSLSDDNVNTIDISPLVYAAVDAVELDEDEDQLRRGNIMARSRMIVLYDYAKKHNLLVCGTENKSEYCLGYFTRFGDEASDFEPIRHLYKTQVYQLAQYLGVSEDILQAPPTAGLWDKQTDEGELGFSYKEADVVLVEYFDELKSIAEIEKQFPFAEKVISYTKKNHFKHEVPYLPDFMVDDE